MFSEAAAEAGVDPPEMGVPQVDLHSEEGRLTKIIGSPARLARRGADEVIDSLYMLLNCHSRDEKPADLIARRARWVWRSFFFLDFCVESSDF
jgi:hypothetical protein